MTAYLKIDEATGLSAHQCGRFDLEDMDGAPPAPVDGFIFEKLTSPIDWRARPSVSHVVKWNGGDWVWFDTETVHTKQARAIAEVDAYADACRLAVVGDAARIKEYEDAQLGAEQYRDAGYTGPVPEAVEAWADAKHREGWTDQQAAEDILAASARWYSALRGIRRMRLDAKETIRAATTEQEVAATAATFHSNLTAAMQGVQ
jgi:hypothetical protein